MKFFVGLHHPCDAQHFDRCLISANTLRTRRKPFEVGEWILDSGGFNEVLKNGTYELAPEAYAELIRRLSPFGKLLTAVSQDYMCSEAVLVRTGLSVHEHQRLTIERFDALRALDTNGVPIMPVLQGVLPAHYASHAVEYGDRLQHGAWVGVGSVVHRQRNVGLISAILAAVLRMRPDLKLHAFGLKTTSLAYGSVRDKLYSGDSISWSWEARKQGRNANDWKEAAAFARRIETMYVQKQLVQL